MTRYCIVIIIFVVGFFRSGYSQSGVKPAGIYEVGDTTIEVYHWKDPYAIREFKIINGTETILYRSFNRLTKKLQEEGTFKGGYSSGKWKFYGWTGRLKKEISYDNMVKTCYEKKIELRPEELFDFAKFKEDSIFVEKYRKQKLQAANKNVVHDTVYLVKPVALPKGTNATVQALEVKTPEPAAITTMPAQSAVVKKEVPAAVTPPPTEAKKTEVVKAASTPAQPTPVKKEIPTAVTPPPTEAKKTEVVKAASTPAQPTPVKKEIPATVATSPTEVKKTEVVKAASTPAQPTPVKKEIPTAVTPPPTEAKKAEVVKAASTPVQPAPVKKEIPTAVTPPPTEAKKAEVVKAASTPVQPAPVKKEIPTAVTLPPTEAKKAEVVKAASTPAQPAPAKKEIPAAVTPPSTEAKKTEPTKAAPAVKKETPEENTSKVTNDKKDKQQTTPAPVKQKKDATFIEQQEVEQTAVAEEPMVVITEENKAEPVTEQAPVEQNEDVALLGQQDIQQTAVGEEKITTTTEETKKEQLSVTPDSVKQEPTAVIEKAEEKTKPINQNLYYAWRANGNWFEISNFKPNEFAMRYDTRTEDKTRFSFYEFALDSIGKLKKEKVIGPASEQKKQSLLKLQRIDSLALIYGMQAMDKPFSHLLEYTVDSTQASNTRFELYITGMPYNKMVEENKITEPFDFIVLNPWTGELITKGNGRAVTDDDGELSIRMTTLIKNQDVQ